MAKRTMTDRLFLVADIGGTNTRVALGSGGGVDLNSVRKFKNAEHADLETILRAYLDDAGAPELAATCIAMAGPVRDNLGTMTNLNWTIDARMIAPITGGPVTVLNDLPAQGYAIDTLPETAFTPLRQGAGNGGGSRLVVGLGTGFNISTVVETDTGPIATPAEAGHVSLPVETAEDLELATYLRAHFGFAALEDALSGRGLSNLHAWHSASHSRLPSDAIMTRLADGDVDAAKAMATFTRLLGIGVGNLALTVLPYGGIYLCGGMARAVAPHLMHNGFETAFQNKGRFGGLLKQFGISVINDDFAALHGCFAYLSQASA